MAYEMGRHVIGYEVQKVLAAVDWLGKDKTPVEVWGYGEGGLIGLYSAALDPRIRNTYVSGYVNNRNDLHKEPIYRNVFGLLREFGDAELLMLAGAPNAMRKVNVEYSKEPAISGPPAPRKGRSGAAPGMLNFTDPKATVARVRTLSQDDVVRRAIGDDARSKTVRRFDGPVRSMHDSLEAQTRTAKCA